MIKAKVEEKIFIKRVNEMRYYTETEEWVLVDGLAYVSYLNMQLTN